MNENDDLERKLSDLLTDGEMEQGDRTAKEIRSISPKYEIRIQTTLDPIVEETLRYRKIGRELDDRYDKYLEQTKNSQRMETDPSRDDSGSTRSGE
ncbi:hypothetical protein [Paenibacillus sp. sgz500958]|uniref:hypothetical protein n=1 Tax=Paenibacillus sp. sgz500958 TaxID=3242475 RepID=UPI0036D28220